MTIQEKAIEQLERISNSLASIGETVDYTDVAIKALEQQSMRDATEEERKSVKDYIESISKPTGVQFEAQPCEDCISREEVQDLISRWLSDYLLDETREALETINCKVGDMPPVKPKRPKGKWIEIEIDAGEFIYKCTKCGMRVINPYKYCPNCGAEMSGGSEDETDS